LCPGNGVLSIHKHSRQTAARFMICYMIKVSLCKIIAAQRGAGKNNDWPE
jgi:hypothetical protein